MSKEKIGPHKPLFLMTGFTRMIHARLMWVQMAVRTDLAESHKLSLSHFVLSVGYHMACVTQEFGVSALQDKGVGVAMELAGTYSFKIVFHVALVTGLGELSCMGVLVAIGTGVSEVEELNPACRLGCTGALMARLTVQGLMLAPEGKGCFSRMVKDLVVILPCVRRVTVLT